MARGAEVINMSLGVSRNGASLLPNGSARRGDRTSATRDGVVVVASAGNNALPLCEQPLVVRS